MPSNVQKRARRSVRITLYPSWKVRLAFGSAIAILCVVGAFSYRHNLSSARHDASVRHTHEVLETLDKLLIVMTRAESDERGFALSGDESYLQQDHASEASANQYEAELRMLTADNADQQRRLLEIAALTAQKLQFMTKVNDLRRTGGIEAAEDAIRTRRGQQIMAAFQYAVGEMQNAELGLLQQRSSDARDSSEETKTVLIVGTILGILIAAAAAWSVERDATIRGLAEEALRESEENYRAMVQGVQSYGIVMLDPDGNVLSWNTGAERMTGRSSAEMVGHSFSRFFLAEDIKQGRPQEILRTVKAEGLLEVQGMRAREDGSRFMVRVTYTALRRPSGALRGFSLVSRNLSDGAESETRYRGLLEAAPDAMVVVNQGGEIVLLNAQAEKRFGYRRDELLGLDVSNIIPEGFSERLIADGLRSAEDALEQQIGAGIELTGRRKDGSEFPIELMLSPLESAEGVLVTAAIRDISVRKAAETHLGQMEARYRGLLEAAPDAMVVVNQGGEIVLLNAQAEKRFGYRRDELLGQDVKDIIPDGFSERLIADRLRTAEDALTQQIGAGIELTGRRKDGSEFPIELMLSPLESAEGVLVTAAIRDISVRKAAETHLGQMEARYRGLLEAAPDAMVVVNQKGEIVLLNAQAEKRFGYRRDELLGQDVKDIIPDGFSERLIADRLRTAEDALTQQIGAGIELTGRRKDRSEFPIELMLSPLESAEGVLVTAAIRDISVRKAAETHLGQMEARYRGLLEAAPDAMVVVNQGGEIVLLNAQAEKRFGYRRDELLGQDVKNIIPDGFSERLIADGLRSAEDALQQQIGAGIELTGRRKDGSEFPIELMLSPLESAEGVLVTAAIRDISTSRAMAGQMARSAADLAKQNTLLNLVNGELAAIVRSSPIAVFATDPAGIVTMWSPAAERLTGFHDQQALGLFLPIVPEDAVEDFRNRVRWVSEGESASNVELMAQKKDGTMIELSISMGPLTDESGVARGAISLAENVTEAVAERKRIARMQSDFVSTVSHELRTPLTSIGGSLALIAGGAAGVINDRATRLVEIANNNTQRLIRLVNDILDIEKLQSGQMVFRFEEVNLDEIVEQAISANLAYVETLGIEIRRLGAASNIFIRADGDRVNQAITNLLSNAAKFSPAGARVEISAARTAYGARVTVSDRGSGISQEFRARIFERFAQADTSDMRKKGGSGLGLSIVRKIMERHGGTVSFDSSPETGTSFHLDFHALPAQGSDPLEAQSDLEESRVLVCALEPALADPIREALREHGFKCALVLSEDDALREAANGALKAAIIEMSFADADVGRFVRNLRDRAGDEQLPIVLVCADPCSRDNFAAHAGLVLPWMLRLAEAKRPFRMTAKIPELLQLDRPAILHVEENHAVLESVRYALQEKFRVVAAPTLELARQFLARDSFDLVILNLDLAASLLGGLLLAVSEPDDRGAPIILLAAWEALPILASGEMAPAAPGRDLAMLVEGVRSVLAAPGRGDQGFNEAAE
jgi:PAS domain S-box-containing protein